MLAHCRVTHSIKFAGAQLHTWVERGTVRVKCLAQLRAQHNVPGQARTRTTRSRGDRASTLEKVDAQSFIIEHVSYFNLRDSSFAVAEMRLCQVKRRFIPSCGLHG